MDQVTKLNLRTEKTEYLTDDDVYNFFVSPPKEMDAITKIKSTYVVGHKGSGKSIILRYLSFPLQLRRKINSTQIPFDKKSIGIHLRSDVGKFGGMTDDPSNHNLNPQWIRHFTHTFNLSILLVLLEHLQEIQKTKYLPIRDQEIKSFLTSEVKLLRFSLSKITLEFVQKKIDTEIDDLQEEYQENSFAIKKRFYTDFRYLFHLRERLRKNFTSFSNLEFVFLLDEYNELTNGQQRVVNDMIKLRHPVFKMSSVPHGYIRIRTNGQQNDIDQDFDVVFLGNKMLTPKSKDFQSTKKLFSSVWDKRISSVLSKPIENILEVPKSISNISGKKKTKADIRIVNELNYTGFENLVLLSSGNPKTFLDLLQNTVDKAYEEGYNLREEAISPKLQLEAILEFSKERRNEIIAADPHLGRNLHRFVEYIGKFLKKKNNQTNRNYRLILIPDDEKLSDLSYNTIALGLNKSWLIQSNLARISRVEKIRLKTITLNNILIPSFELPLASQQTWEMDPKLIDDVIEHSKDTDSIDTKEIKKRKPKTDKKIKPKPISIGDYGFLDDIKKLIQDDKIVLFIGSGLSTSAGIISAQELFEKLCNEIGIPVEQVKTLAEAAEYYSARTSDVELNGFLRKLIDSEKINLDLHKKIANLPITKIIMTNWDNLLEKAYDSLDKKYDVVVDSLELGNYDEKKIGIFKMHGDFNHQGMIVITQDQYAKFETTHDFMLTRIKSMLQNRGVLFIGYSLNDYNFNQIRSKVLDEMGTLRSSYIVLRDVKPNQKNALEKKGIKVIESDFQAVLNYLCEFK